MKTESKMSKMGWMQRFRLRDVAVALGIVGAALFVPGCFVSSDPAPVCLDSQIQPSWIISANNQIVECAPGDEVDMRVDDDSHIFTFPCADHSGVTTAVPAGTTHDVSFQLYDASQHLLSETGSMSLFVPCNTIQATPRVEFSLTQ